MKWFKHDADANQDAKLRRVRLKYGMEGYGLYWYCLEMIARGVEKHNLSFELEHDSELIAADTGIHRERVEEMMRYMVDLRLFERADGVITCLKMASRTDEYTQSLLKRSGECPESVPRVSRECPDKRPRPSRQTPETIGRKSELIEQNRTEQNITTQPPEGGRPKRAAKSLIPDGLELTQERRNRALTYWAARDRMDLIAEDEFGKFVAHHRANGSRMVDWDAAWTKWYSNAVGFAPKLRSAPAAAPHWSTQGLVI